MHWRKGWGPGCRHQCLSAQMQILKLEFLRTGPLNQSLQPEKGCHDAVLRITWLGFQMYNACSLFKDSIRTVWIRSETVDKDLQCYAF